MTDQGKRRTGEKCAMFLPTEKTFTKGEKVVQSLHMCLRLRQRQKLNGGWRRWSHFVRLFVFPVCEAVSTPPEASACALVCMRAYDKYVFLCDCTLTQDIITLSSLSKSSSSSSSRSSTACWQM